MRIISKFRDYYDTSLGYGLNSDVIYVREEQKIQIELKIPSYTPYRALSMDIPFSKKFNAKWMGMSRTVNVIPIGFCGKIYYAYSYCNLYSLNFNDLISLISLKLKKRESIVFNEEAEKEKARLNVRLPEITNSLLKGNYFESLGAPYYVLLISGRHDVPKLIANYNCLQNLKFTSQFDATAAYQEIEMYFNSVLTKRENPLQITDSKVLLLAKGFDDKTSFRHPIKL